MVSTSRNEERVMTGAARSLIIRIHVLIPIIISVPIRIIGSIAGICRVSVTVICVLAVGSVVLVWKSGASAQEK